MIDSSGGDSLLSNTTTILQGEYSESEKNFLTQLTEPKNFLTPLKASLQNRFNLPENLMDTLTPNTLTLQDIFEIYAIMR